MVTIDEEKFRQAQQALEPREDLAPYAGQWVVLREGKVIASDLDLQPLLDREDARDDDVIIPVANHQGQYLVV